MRRNEKVNRIIYLVIKRESILTVSNTLMGISQPISYLTLNFLVGKIWTCLKCAMSQTTGSSNPFLSVCTWRRIASVCSHERIFSGLQSLECFIDSVCCYCNFAHSNDVAGVFSCFHPIICYGFEPSVSWAHKSLLCLCFLLASATIPGFEVRIAGIALKLFCAVVINWRL